MTQPGAVSTDKPNTSLLIRGAIWIAIGALIAAALVCVVWVLIGDQNGIVGRAFLTILLLAGFAGIAILEAGLAAKRPEWLALASMITWIVALIVGAVKIWLPETSSYFGSGAERFFQLLLVVGILQLALLHVRLYTPAARRYVTTFTQVIHYVTVALLVILVGLLVFYLTLPDTFDYGELYWRIVVAVTILVAVGTTLIPLLNALFAPKKAAVAPFAGAAIAAPVAPAAAAAWPTYADGVTPLPVLPDGSPDWNAYYTGVPSATQGGFAPADAPVWSVPQGGVPEPVVPEPAMPEPAVPAQTLPDPVVQAPTLPEPVQPEPVQPEPAQAEPVQPEPAAPDASPSPAEQAAPAAPVQADAPADGAHAVPPHAAEPVAQPLDVEPVADPTAEQAAAPAPEAPQTQAAPEPPTHQPPAPGAFPPPPPAPAPPQ